MIDHAGEMAAFVRVVEARGFSAAAPTLGLTPSAVSKLITRLEARLGVRLLQRTTRALHLTADGELFFEAARIPVANLLGERGTGFRTFLKILDGGRISIGGRVVSEPERGLLISPRERDIGMVFQSYAIWPHMTVFDNVAYPLRIRRRGRAEIDGSTGRTLAQRS